MFSLFELVHWLIQGEPPPTGSISFAFAKKCTHRRSAPPQWASTPRQWEILDPPLLWLAEKMANVSSNLKTTTNFYSLLSKARIRDEYSRHTVEGFAIKFTLNGKNTATCVYIIDLLSVICSVT